MWQEGRQAGGGRKAGRKVAGSRQAVGKQAAGRQVGKQQAVHIYYTVFFHININIEL